MLITAHYSDRPDTIKAIVASLVGDGESGESLIDDNEPIQPLQSVQVDDYMDPNWEPEPIDAGPGESLNTTSPYKRVADQSERQTSARINLVM